MRKFPLRTVGLATGIVIGLAVLNSYVFQDGLFSGRFGTAGIPLFEKTRSISNWFRSIKHWGALIQENTDLKRQNADLIALSARLADVEEENELLRQAARVARKVPQELIPGSLFSVTLDPSGHHAMVNKGRRNGVRSGDVVVSGEGILVGQILEVFDSTARASLVKDPTFEITAQVLEGVTTGLVRGNLSQGLLFDLVAQEEEIKEGDMIISTGSDQFPAGLVIGQVENVEVNETKLFKEVRIRPSAESVTTGRILIIHNP